MDTQPLQLGRVAQKTGLSIDAIRFYERSGLLPRPARSEGGYRLYRQREVADLESIQKAQQLGFSLREIRELFSIQRHQQEMCVHVRDLIVQKMAVVRSKMAELQTLEAGLSTGLKQCRKALRQGRNIKPPARSYGRSQRPVRRGKIMTIEILYFSGCPNHRPAVAHVSDILREEKLSAELVEVEVKDADAAHTISFLGSPSIRIDGRDVEPAARSSRAFGLTCRTYIIDGHRTGVPPSEWIRAAMHDAQQNPVR